MGAEELPLPFKETEIPHIWKSKGEKPFCNAMYVVASVGRFQKLLCYGAVIFGLLFFVLPVRAETSLFDIDVAQQKNFEENDTSSTTLKGALASAQEGIIMTPTVSVISTTENLVEENAQDNSSQQPAERRESIEYTIKEGDTISGIAAAFNLKTKTILWANDLHDWSIIKPGDSITIPPKDGLLYTVKAGDTLSKIAQVYKADLEEIREWNQLDADKIVEGQELFLPNATKPVVVAKSSPGSSSSSSTNSSQQTSRSAPIYFSNNGGHQFPYGYCTWYVAQKRYVPWGGNAKDWLSNAQAYGYNVCWGSDCSCPAGSILVTRESWYGHVAYVESSNASTITISEMNRYGWAKTNTRTLTKGAWVIRGCIY